MASPDRPKPTKLRKRYGKAQGTGRVIVVDLDDPKWAPLRRQLLDSTLATQEEADAHLRWLESDEP
jgi:hypothetical protein